MAKQTTGKKKYKAVDVMAFKESFNNSTPCYQKLSKGDEVSLDLNSKHVANWLRNNIIKEVK
jgi:glycerol-3-phosphate O-acyltransferase